MVKYMGEERMELLGEVCNEGWRREQIPKDWEVREILPLYKKGDCKDCNNY